jgi:hypothetical protein
MLWTLGGMVVRRVASAISEHRPSAAVIAADTYGDAAAGAIVKARDVRALGGYLAGARDDWSQRYFCSLAMSRHFPEKKLRRWTATEPDSADAHLVHGARLFRQALDVRGYGRGESINEARWKKFHAALETAEGVLQRAAELHPADPTPWAYLVAVALHHHGTANPFVEQRCFEQAIARDPDNWHAHMHRLIGLSKKYGGSHEAMFEFARGAAQNAAPGSLLPALIFKAHVEFRKYLRGFDNDPAAAAAYAQNPQVISECLDVYQRTLAMPRADNHDATLVRINAAATLWMLKQKEPLRAELERLGTRVHDVHWKFLAAPGELARAKQFAFS